MTRDQKLAEVSRIHASIVKDGTEHLDLLGSLNQFLALQGLLERLADEVIRLRRERKDLP